MKKILLICALCLLPISTMAAEKTCNGGTLITANSVSDSSKGINCGTNNEKCNGYEFCKSDNSMNWWSAWTWCASQNRQLAAFTDMCPTAQTSPNNVEGACPNLKGKGSGWMWSSYGYGSSDALFVNLSSGAVDGRGRHTNNYAFCR